MTTDTNKIMAILSLIVVTTLLLGSCIVDFKLCDLFYLLLLYFYVVRYMFIRKKQ